jgi:hypothetical protein
MNTASPADASRDSASADAAHMDIQAALTFIVPQTEKPYFESAALTGGEPKVHFKTEARSVTIRNMRERADDLSLDTHGFKLLSSPTRVVDLYDDAEVLSTYQAELQALLTQATGADRAIIFDATRRSDAPQGAANPDGQRGPADRVHVDYTVLSGPKRARDALGDAEVDRVLASGGRIAQINVWRPISGPVKRTPLALADAQSISAAERVATEQRFPDRVGEIYQIAYGAQQRWYWAPEMSRDEVILIKGWDSLDDGRARFAPHGAFQLPHQDPHAPSRESIEVRTYVIFEHDNANAA